LNQTNKIWKSSTTIKCLPVNNCFTKSMQIQLKVSWSMFTLVSVEPCAKKNILNNFLMSNKVCAHKLLLVRDQQQKCYWLVIGSNTRSKSNFCIVPNEQFLSTPNFFWVRKNKKLCARAQLRGNIDHGTATLNYKVQKKS